MFWNWLIPASPSTIIKAFRMTKTVIRDNAEIRRIDKSGILVLVPLIVMFSPLVIAALVLVLTTPIDFAAEPPDAFDLGFYAWAGVNLYWAIGVMAKSALAFRSAVERVSAGYVASGINPNATLSTKR